MQYITNHVNYLTVKTAKGVNLVKRETFDPKNTEHIQSLKKFITSGNWGKVQFFIEFPYVDVPTSVLMKFAKHTLNETA